MRTCLFLFLLGPSLLLGQENPVPLPQENPAAEKPRPRNVFSLALWNYQGRLDVAYAPWGNHQEGNATLVPLTLVTGARSEKCAYYGAGKLVLLRPKQTADPEAAAIPEYEKFHEVVLPFKTDRTSETLLLLGPGRKEGEWRVSPLDFDPQVLPKGKFSFISRSPVPLSLSFGEEKFALPAGGAKKVNGIIKEGERTIKLSVFSRQGGARPVFAQEWPHVNGLRGMFFLGSKGNAVQVTRFVDFPRPIEQALGYGSPRITIPDKSPREEY